MVASVTRIVPAVQERGVSEAGRGADRPLASRRTLYGAPTSPRIASCTTPGELFGMAPVDQFAASSQRPSPGCAHEDSTTIGGSPPIAGNAPPAAATIANSAARRPRTTNTQRANIIICPFRRGADSVPVRIAPGLRRGPSGPSVPRTARGHKAFFVRTESRPGGDAPAGPGEIRSGRRSRRPARALRRRTAGPSA